MSTAKIEPMKTNKPKILAISPVPPPYGGLANNMRLYLASSLFDDYDTTLLNLSAGQEREKDPDKPTLFTVLYCGFVLLKLVYLLVKIQPDLVYMKAGAKQGFIRDICIILICKLFGKKLICHLHSKSSGVLFLDKSGLRHIFRWCMRFPEKVILLTENLKREFSDLIDQDKLVVINNVVDTSLFDEHPDKKKSKKLLANREPINVLYVGRLIENKGFYDLLETIPLIVAQEKNVKFQFAGLAENEEEELKIKEYCTKPPFKDYVALLGIVRGKTKVITFMDADIFVLPTSMDNMPNAVLEALATGLPIVSTSVAQIPSMIEDGVNGFIVEPGNISQLAERLLTLIKSHDLRDRMRQANRQKAREIYDIEIGVKRMKEVFNSLLPCGYPFSVGQVGDGHRN